MSIDLLFRQLAAMPDEELAALFQFCGANAVQWPVFAQWLAQLLTLEMDRRSGGDLATKWDVARLPDQWPDAALADALEGAAIFSYSPAGVSEATAAVLQWSVAHVTGLAADRLRRRHDITTAVRSN